jgi:FlaG/FlaF family flagellin (archaellin)
MLNKKGMSPLLLTIILIAFAVALGAMIMSWGSNKVYPSKSSCEDAEIVVQKAFGNDLICFNENSDKLKIVVKNSGQTTLSGLIYRKISPDLNIRDITLPSSALEIGKIYEAEIPHQFGERTHIEIIPQVTNNEQQTICDNKAIIRENISPCKLS